MQSVDTFIKCVCNLIGMTKPVDWTNLRNTHLFIRICSYSPHCMSAKKTLSHNIYGIDHVMCRCVQAGVVDPKCRLTAGKSALQTQLLLLVGKT